LGRYDDNRKRVKMGDPLATLSNQNPLNFIQADRITRPVIQLRRPGHLVRGDLLRVLNRPAVFQLSRDASYTK
jgi:hypothetical protein